jgi:hypothetical protein
LSKVINNDWDVKAALIEKNEYRRLEDLENLVNEQLNTYAADSNKKYDFGKPDERFC